MCEASPVQTTTQVFVGNLPLEFDEQALDNALTEHGGGGFVGLRLTRDMRGTFKGFGYLDFETKDAAEAMVASMNGVEIEGRPLKVDIAPPRVPRVPQDQSIFIGNLHFDITKEGIHDMVNEAMGAGKVLKVRFMIDKYTRQPKGLGFIDFVDAESATEALEKLNGAEIMGRQLRVARPTRREDRQNSQGSRGGVSGDNTVFLGNLSWDVTTELLEDMLNDLVGPGSFTRVRMSVDKVTGRMKGFAHIDFVDQEQANRAVQELNGIELLGRSMRVDKARQSDRSIRDRFEY